MASSPLARSVADRLSDLIRAGDLAEGVGLPSERDLSNRFGVSRGVVRLAIKDLTARGVIESKAHCRPVVARRARARDWRRQIFIWLWPNSADFAASSVMKGIQNAGIGDDVRLVVGHAHGKRWESIFESESRFLLDLSLEPRTSGSIVWLLGHERSLPALQAVRDRGISMVFIDRLPPAGFDGDYVGTNNEASAEAAVEHLVALGHRRIALLTNIDGSSSVREREAGYRRALASNGLSVDPDLILTDSVDDPEGVYELIARAARQRPRPTALFCINDHLALQARDSACSLGLSVPEDLSIVGFDGILRWLPLRGGLTTLNQDFHRIGQIAAQLVIERMAGWQPAAYRHVLLDAPLVDNGSTAPAPVPASNGGCLK